jgi:hypothetical protein
LVFLRLLLVDNVFKDYFCVKDIVLLTYQKQYKKINKLKRQIKKNPQNKFDFIQQMRQDNLEFGEAFLLIQGNALEKM